MNKYKLCKHRANLGIKIHFITTLTQSNKEYVEIYNTDRKDNIIIKFRLPIKVHIIHHTLPNGFWKYLQTSIAASGIAMVELNIKLLIFFKKIEEINI